MHLSSGLGLHVVLSLPSKACSLLSMWPRVLRWKGFCCFFFPLNLCSFGVCKISQAKGSLFPFTLASSAGGTMDQRYKPGRVDLFRELAKQSTLDSLLKASLVLLTSHSPRADQAASRCSHLLTQFPLLEFPSLLPPHRAKKSLHCSVFNHFLDIP